MARLTLLPSSLFCCCSSQPSPGSLGRSCLKGFSSPFDQRSARVSRTSSCGKSRPTTSLPFSHLAPQSRPFFLACRPAHTRFLALARSLHTRTLVLFFGRTLFLFDFSSTSFLGPQFIIYQHVRHQAKGRRRTCKRRKRAGRSAASSAPLGMGSASSLSTSISSLRPSSPQATIMTTLYAYPEPNSVLHESLKLETHFEGGETSSAIVAFLREKESPELTTVCCLYLPSSPHQATLSRPRSARTRSHPPTQVSLPLLHVQLLERSRHVRLDQGPGTRRPPWPLTAPRTPVPSLPLPPLSPQQRVRLDLSRPRSTTCLTLPHPGGGCI